MRALRVLIVEDSDDDGRLLVEHLRRAGYQVTSERVETARAMTTALVTREWDVVLSDYHMPQFSAQAALDVLQASGLDLPCIIVSGTIGEDTAVACLKAGANDFVLKDKLARLVPAIEREVREAGVRRQRAETEAALRDSERRYRELVEGLPVGIYRTTPDGTLLDANAVCLEMFGLPPGPVPPGLDVSTLYANPSERDRWRALADRDELIGGAELQVRRPDGSFLWVRDTGRAVRGPDGTVSCYEGVLEDITALRVAEAESRRGAARFRALTEYASDVLTIIAANGAIEYESPAVRHVLGYQPTELLGRNVFDYVHPDDLERVREMVAQGLADPKVIGRITYRFRHKDGTWRHLDSVGRNLLGEGAVRGIVINSRDLTERVQLEEQYRQAQKMEAVGQLAGGVAHDFNNLLTVIDANATFLLQGLGPNDPRRSDAEEIKRAAERAASLTRQLLAFSRRQVLQPRVLDVNTIVADMDKMLRRLIGEDVELATVLTPGVMPVLADPGQVEQVILNLTVNARDAMPQGGKLTIETRNVELDAGYAATHQDVKAGPYVMMAVSDTGTGMTPETQRRIFEPFFTTKGYGTGLGLATVYGIVKQSGGHIAVYSEPGQGATFKVYLPVTNEAAGQRRTGEMPVPSARATETVLLVEDEPSVRTVSSRVLRGAGYTVLEAFNGSQALELAGRHAGPIDVLVTDVIMPQIGGRELMELLVALRPGVKVLYVSGYTDDSMLHRAALEPGVFFLEKPFTPEAILRKLRQVLAAPPSAGPRRAVS